MPRRKIVFVIVEGPSDDTALGVILTRLFDADTVFVKITHGDITSDFEVNASNIVSKLGDLVKQCAAAEHYNPSDFKHVIHLIDMDGAFIPDEAVVQDDTAAQPFYSLTNIHTANPTAIIFRNHRKAGVIRRICGLKQVWNTIPYQAFYMSSNLDHVLYNKLNSTDDEKEYDAYAFVRRYKDRLEDFLTFISDSDFSHTGDFNASWTFIQQSKHSLERHTNLGICFAEIRKTRNQHTSP